MLCGLADRPLLFLVSRPIWCEPLVCVCSPVERGLHSGFTVTIQCKAREMVAKVKTSKVFNGKVYAKARPNSCVMDVVNSLDFQIRMAYHELECDVKQEVSGTLLPPLLSTAPSSFSLGCCCSL